MKLNSLSIVKILLLLCIVAFFSILLSYYILYNTELIDGFQRDLISDLFIISTAIICIRWGIKNVILAGIIFLPIYFVIFFLAACSVFRDCL